MRTRAKHISCAMEGCRKRYTSTAAMVRHVRAAHEGQKDYQRASYWMEQCQANRKKYGRSTIKLPPSERKKRERDRKDKEREQRRQDGAGTFKSGKGGRPPQPIRSGRPPASKALALKSVDEPNPRQLTRALMKRPESSKATPASSKTMPK